MAVYKIFPEKSATLYSYTPTKNTGIDEILEVSLYDNSDLLNRGDVARSIIKFPTSEINDIIGNKVSGSNYSASLKLYLADASSLPISYTLHCYPISGAWDRGTGRATSLPVTTNGVSWIYKQNSNFIKQWTTSSYTSGVTSSYEAQGGGGNWYYNYSASQVFTVNDEKDVNLDITNAVAAIYDNMISNEGFIIKHDPSLEFTTGSTVELKYFSQNTHTIYPPCLEIKWNDFIYNTGSLGIISNDKIVATLSNNQGEYQQNAVQRFRINIRDRYPTRVFQTSSIYLNNKLLPTSSYWQIKDVDNDQIVVDFDQYTKISADGTSNYFDIYMSGLQPERYYKVLIKTTISGSTLILDNNYIFKVVK